MSQLQLVRDFLFIVFSENKPNIYILLHVSSEALVYKTETIKMLENNFMKSLQIELFL